MVGADGTTGDRDRDAFLAEVVAELRALLGEPAWRLPQGPPARRELARLEILARRAPSEHRERTRQRAARERTRPWHEEERFTLRGRIWRERRDEQWAAVDRREQLLPPADELPVTEAMRERWLADLRALDAASAGWEGDEDAVWHWRKDAAARRAAELLARDEVREALPRPGRVASARASAVGRAVALALLGLARERRLAAPPSPVLCAAVAAALIARARRLDADADT